jgi:hypothetical protein
MPAQVAPTLWQSIQITLRVIWRVTRQVFHETTGVFFALFAVYFAVAAWRQWKSHPSPWLIAFAILCALMMAGSSFYAFFRARRVR